MLNWVNNQLHTITCSKYMYRLFINWYQSHWAWLQGRKLKRLASILALWCWASMQKVSKFLQHKPSLKRFKVFESRKATGTMRKIVQEALGWDFGSMQRHVALLRTIPIPSFEEKVKAGRWKEPILVLGNPDRVTAPLPALLWRSPDSCDSHSSLSVNFSTCQMLFREELSLKDSTDFCAGKLLERAFLWACAVKSGGDSVDASISILSRRLKSASKILLLESEVV